MASDHAEEKAGGGLEENAPAEEQGAEQAEPKDQSDQVEEQISDENCPQCAKLEAALAEKQQEYEELAARTLRLQADFDNFRRRTRQEKEELVSRASEGIITRLLPVLDDLERALAAADSGNQGGTLADGVRMVQRSLLKNLQDEGLEVVPGEGAEFDPHLHEAVARDSETEGEKEIVIEEFRKGYLLAGRVLRPAMVKVGHAPEAKEE